MVFGSSVFPAAEKSNGDKGKRDEAKGKNLDVH